MAKRHKRKKAADGDVFPSTAGGAATAPSPATGNVTRRAASWGFRDGFCGFVLILAVILTYTPVWQAGFVWDGSSHITANPCIVGPLGLKEIWMIHGWQFFPLVITMFWVAHAWWGLA